MVRIGESRAEILSPKSSLVPSLVANKVLAVPQPWIESAQPRRMQSLREYNIRLYRESTLYDHGVKPGDSICAIRQA